MANRHKTLVPNARKGLDGLKAQVSNVSSPDQAKYEVAKDLGILLHSKYNGNLQAKDAGKIGGTIGGSMVKEMIKMAKNQLNQ